MDHRIVGYDKIEWQPEDRRVYLTLFARTLKVAGLVTAICLLLGYPIAYLLASLPLRKSNLLMILVLLPFWTSLLVRTAAWKVLLQQQGVINDILVWLGMIADDERLVMINNATGTIIAMTHILLPFMILPLYSVMKTDPAHLPARGRSRSGANDWTAFWRVYFPQTVPGIGAGAHPRLHPVDRLLHHAGAGRRHLAASSSRTGSPTTSRPRSTGASRRRWRRCCWWWCWCSTGLYDRIVGIDNVKLG